MADSKKYNGSTWEHSLRKLATATDTFTTLPVDVYADGNNATVGISGNTVQSGTPSPDNPITPQGTGERTGNLFDDDNVEFGKWVNSNGLIVTNAAYAAGCDIKVGTASEFAIKHYGNKPYSYSMAFYDSNGNFLSRVHRSNPSSSYDTFPVPENAVSARFQVAVDTSEVMTSAILKAMKLMLNSGSTPLPYEPYGYKIPISSANTTTPVYLGEAETTRYITELVLTGEETFVRSGSGDSAFYRLILSDSARTDSLDSSLCSHFTYNTISSSNTDIGFFILSDGSSVRMRPNDVASSTLQTFTTWLSQQYANGTPVTVWYVLATPTTGIVNEPIRKIGDYADTVSGITIPTITGADSFDVLTTLKPSEVTVNYKGWHTGAVHERDSGQWN